MLGPSDTGKSTLIALLEALVGQDNARSISLQKLTEDRFTLAYLYEVMMNACADLDARMVKHSGVFKMLVSGDSVTVERKFEHPFTCRPFARMVFSANEPPGTADQSDAWYKRWLILPMGQKVPLGEQDANLIPSIIASDELSGFLRYAVEGLRRLMARGRFDVPESMRAAAEDYRARTDTVVAFVEEACLLDPDARERSGDLYQAYSEWCKENGRQAIGRQRLIEHLPATYPVSYKRAKGYPTWFGLRLRTATDVQDEPEVRAWTI